MRANEVFDGKAASWLNSPLFNGFKFSAIEHGTRSDLNKNEVLDLLGRIEHGIYS